MKFEINGVQYDPIEGLKKASLQTLYELKARHGIGMKSLMASAKRLDGIKDPMDLLEDVDSFQTFRVVIWLARRHAGEKITLEEANDDFAITDLKMISEESDAPAEAPDPKSPAGSARAKKRRPAKPTH